MSKINIEELNYKIANSDLEGLLYQEYMTPEFSSFKIKNPPKNICRDIARYEIRNKFINNHIHENYEIDESLYEYICEFILGENIPEEEKNIVTKYLNNNLKQIISEKYVETEFKNKNMKIDPDDLTRQLWYTPKHNNVPLKKYYENNNIISYKNDFEVSFSRIKEILSGRAKEVDSFEWISIKHLLNENSFFEKPWCPNKIRELKNKLNKSKLEKLENKICEYNDYFIKKQIVYSPKVEHKIHINDNFKKEILNSVPNEFSILEKSIYIYSKLCKILSYDPIYYLNNKVKNHEEVKNIENYDLDNNNIVCYEFSYIFSDLLREIGVTNIRENLLSDQKFENKHANISYLLEDVVIFADSTRTVNKGDLTTQKYSNELTGIRCEMYNKEFQKKFADSKRKVTSYIEQKNKELNYMLPNKKSIDNLSINEKMVLFNNMLINCNLKNTDFISYANRLISILKLDINTNIYYDNETSSKLLLQVNIIKYDLGNKTELSYLIDSESKSIYTNYSDLYSYKEVLTSRRL